MNKLILLLFIFLSFSIYAQNFWEQTNGPSGGTTHSLAINSSGYIFAGTDHGGVFLSTNNGTSWTAVNNGLTGSGLTVNALAVSGTNIFAGTQSGVYLSTNNGSNWTQRNNGYNKASTYVLSLAINSDGDVFAGAYGVYRSTDNGNSWTQTGMTDKWANVLSINSSGDIFMGTGGNALYHNGVYRSTDNGNNWTQVVEVMGDFDVSSLAINSNGNIFAGGYVNVYYYNTQPQLYRSMDNGNNWTLINNGLPTNTYFSSLAINSSGYIFAGTPNGVFRSTDNGNNWTQTGMTIGNLSLVINSSGYIFAGTWGEIFRSTDNGNNWTQKNSGVTATYAQALAINSSGNIFAGTNYSGVFSSTDSGDNWAQINNGLPQGNVNCLAINNSGNIFAGIWNFGVFLSTNNGTSWAKTSLTNSQVSSFATDSSGDVFAGAYGVFRSTDNGNHWTQTGLINRTVNSIAINSSGDIFAGSDSEGVFRSTDNGNNWSKKNSGLTNTSVICLAINNSGNIFAGIWNSGVFLSTNNGTSWTAVNNGLTGSGLAVNALAVSGTNLFAGTSGGVYLSTNNGTSWTAVNNGLTNSIVLALAISRTNLFAGTYGGGVWKRPLLDAPTLTSPANNATLVAINPILTWSAGTLATSYRVQVATNINFTALIKDTTITDLTFALSGLANNTQYFWRVYSINGPGQVVSAVFNFTTIIAVPGASTLTTPANNATGVENNPTLTWTAGTLATSYRVQVATDINFTARLKDTLVTSGLTLALSSLSDNTQYFWRVYSINDGGQAVSSIFNFSVHITGIKEDLSGIPSVYSLYQNYPNPFNPSTVIRYAIPFDGNVNIRFYNSLGQCVREENAGIRQSGYYELNFNSAGLSSGVYFYSIKAVSTDGKNNFSSVKKMILMK